MSLGLHNIRIAWKRSGSGWMSLCPLHTHTPPPPQGHKHQLYCLLTDGKTITRKKVARWKEDASRQNSDFEVRRWFRHFKDPQHVTSSSSDLFYRALRFRSTVNFLMSAHGRRHSLSSQTVQQITKCNKYVVAQFQGISNTGIVSLFCSLKHCASD